MVRCSLPREVLPFTDIASLMADPVAWQLIFLIFIQMVFVTMVYGPIAAYLVEAFPAKIRYTALSLPYHIGNGVFGGLLPVIGLSDRREDRQHLRRALLPDRRGDAHVHRRLNHAQGNAQRADLERGREAARGPDLSPSAGTRRRTDTDTGAFHDTGQAFVGYDAETGTRKWGSPSGKRSLRSSSA